MWLFKTYWILGQNARNLNYIKEYNTPIARKLADSKFWTKEFLRSKKVWVPNTLFIFNSHWDITEDLINELEPPFVIKPNSWFWWKGIIVIDSKDSVWNFVANNWDVYSVKKIISHLYSILDGFFSISWTRDKVMVEKKVVLDHEIELLWKYWLPDIRIIVFNLVPIMAMLRIPTEKSWWKANLHSWACWVWIDIWTWKLTYISQFSKIIKSIPWIGDVRWIEIPNWEQVLNLAVKVQKVTSIWYLWCDVVLDYKDWPLILEINIRPWLELQIANMAPLQDRLDRVSWIYINSVEKWVRVWRDLFSWDIEERIKKFSWRKIVWKKEYIEIFYEEKKYKYIADIKMCNSSNYIDSNFVRDVLKIPKTALKSNSIRLKFSLLWEKKNLKFLIKDLWSSNILLWLNSLKWFIIDPFKNVESLNETQLYPMKNKAITKTYSEQLQKIDKEITSIDKKLLILKAITPINIKEEKEKFVSSEWKYVPELKYNDLNLDLDSLLEKVWKIEIPEIPLSNIYKRKKEEIINKIAFLKAFKLQNTKSFTLNSKKLFWDLTKENLALSKNRMSFSEKIKLEEEFLSFEDIKWFIKKFNHIYWIKLNLKIWDRAARFVMKWDTLVMRKDALVWKKELRSIIAHEIEWHYLRRLNGKKLPYSIFSSWTAGYIEIDEGIAIYNQNRFLSETDKKYYSIFERYYFLEYALNHSYKKLLHKMEEYYENDYWKIFNYILRLKRWLKSFSSDWFFTKDSVYVNWFIKVEDFLESSWELRELYLWKMTLEDLEEIKESNFIAMNLSDLKVPFFL